MQSFVMLLVAVSLVTSSPAPKPYSNIFQIDISPEEAQNYIINPPFTEPKLSGRTAVLPLVRYNDPRFRTAEAGPTLGHYWKNGHEIENPDDYVEEVYNAAQFHGQDGLGAYVYGYEAPESAKVENRQRSGDVQGSYTYKSGNNDIKVRYWADSQGFHQEDNIPKYVPKPVEEAPEVKQARLAHEKAWKEAADLALHPAKLSNENYNYYDAYNNQNPQGQASEQQRSFVPSPLGEASDQQRSFVPTTLGQAQSNNYQSNNYQGKYQGANNERANYQSGYQGDYKGNYESTTEYQDPEPTGPPRGFFYSYTYPVSIIVPKNEFDAQSAPAIQEN